MVCEMFFVQPTFLYRPQENRQLDVGIPAAAHRPSNDPRRLDVRNALRARSQPGTRMTRLIDFQFTPTANRNTA